MQILPEHLEFGYIGRPERASPGEGYPAAHTVEQNRIIRTALDLVDPGLGEPGASRRASAEPRPAAGLAAQRRRRTRRGAAVPSSPAAARPSELGAARAA